MRKIQVEVNTSEVTEALQRVISTSPQMRKLFIKLIREQLNNARKKVSQDMKLFVGKGLKHSSGDPRQAFRAVKSSIWKSDLGGSISVFSKKRRSNNRVNFTRDRKLDKNPNQRGGNRIKRSNSTKASELDKYWGSDRYFIYNFLISGTSARTSRYGNRGSITGRNFFSPYAKLRVQEAAKEIDRQVMDAWDELFYNK